MLKVTPEAICAQMVVRLRVSECVRVCVSELIMFVAKACVRVLMLWVFTINSIQREIHSHGRHIEMRPPFTTHTHTHPGIRGPTVQVR